MLIAPLEDVNKANSLTPSGPLRSMLPVMLGPNITGSVTNTVLEITKQVPCSLFVDCGTSGAFSNGGTKRAYPFQYGGCDPSDTKYNDTVILDTSHSNSIYRDDVVTVQTSSLILNCIIKY